MNHFFHDWLEGNNWMSVKVVLVVIQKGEEVLGEEGNLIAVKIFFEISPFFTSDIM